MKKTSILLVFWLFLILNSYSQVDTTFIYNANAPYGTLDLRIAKSATRYYYLQEDITFSYRESAPGVPTNTFADMTSWDSSPYTEGNLREKNGSADEFVMNYRLLKPSGYQANYAKGYPLIILFHGAGESANCWKTTCYHATSAYDPVVNDPPAPTSADHELLNNDHNLLHGGLFYMDAVDLAGNKLPDDATLPEGAFPGFALFPQSLNGWSGDESQDAIRIIRLLVKKYNIDPDRIYLSGLSFGGHGAYEALKRAPWLFAAGILMSAVDDGFITAVNMQDKTASVPLWLFQGSLDKNPYPNETKNYMKKFREAGAVIRYTEYPDIGHTTWNRAFQEPDYFSWLLGSSKSNVHPFAGSTVICDAGEGRLLQLPDGFKAYQWEYNGSIISGATTSSYNATAAGKYRGRFSRISTTPSEAQWNEWSPEITVTTGSVPVAGIKQVGTTLLRDLNNGNEALLESTEDFAHYYWYKNGTFLNVPDTLKAITIKAGSCNGSCSGNGIYTLVTADFDNCESDPSPGKAVFFNNQAPLNISAPTQFTGTAESPSAIILKWKDNADNENGYEVWRRRKISDTEFSAWEMPTLTAANATTFTDNGLVPSSTYHYKIRGVSNTGRSEYSPAAATEALVVITTADTEPPAAPLNLTYKRTGIDNIKLMWNSAEDDSGIKEYTITFADQTLTVSDTSVAIGSLQINETYSFKVAAVDAGGNVGPESNQVVVFTGVYGLFYGHTPGGWTTLDSIDWAMPEYTGMIQTFSLSPKTQEDYFSFRFDGYLYITDPGMYQFRTSSDDGSRLTLDNTRIVDNNGIHELKTVASSARDLAEGAHRITVDFFEYSESDSLSVEYKGPDTNNEWAVIPATALRSTLVVATDPLQNPGFAVDIYPNPTDEGNLNIIVESLQNLPVSVSLIDPLGRQIFDEAFGADELREGVRIRPQEKLVDGIYLVRIHQGESIVQRKVLIRH
jgi:hypothetical protein